MSQLSDPPASPPPTGTPRRPKRLLRRLAFAFAAVIGLVLLGAGAGWIWLQSRLQASLPQLDGTKAIAGLSAAVEIERDDLGVPTIHAVSRIDAVRALGFLHAQDRFFQMDLLRRQGAAELAEIFGSVAAQSDRQRRIHRFRDVARRVVAQLPADDRALLSAYSEGANAGLSALAAKPFEYLVLRTDPAPWQPEDSILVFYAMFFELHDEMGRGESNLGYLHDTLPSEMFHFISPAGTDWDAPLVGETFEQPPVPAPNVIDLRTRRAAVPKTTRLQPEIETQIAAAGSNNWAVAAAHSADGHAWLANDIHITLGVPNIIYRASVIRPDEMGGTVRITGGTLPGAPFVVVGSNGHVAWGLTNAYGDWTDLVVLETDSKDAEMYRTPEGWRRFEHVRERIRIKGSEDQSLDIRQTIWGP
jgi:penicillin amidase